MKKNFQMIITASHQSSLVLCENYFLKQGVKVIPVYSLYELKKSLSNLLTDILLCDIDLHDSERVSIIKNIGLQNTMGVIVFTHMVDPIDKYIALETYADDFIQKPCCYREVLARIRAVHRRIQINKKQHKVNIYSNNFVINRLSRIITLKTGENIRLTQYEFDVLNTLVSHKNQPLSREKIIDITFDFLSADTITPRNIDSIIYRLRKKLADKNSIETLYGVGYVFQEVNSISVDSTPKDTALIVESINQLAEQASKR